MKRVGNTLKRFWQWYWRGPSERDKAKAAKWSNIFATLFGAPIALVFSYYMMLLWPAVMNATQDMIARQVIPSSFLGVAPLCFVMATVALGGCALIYLNASATTFVNWLSRHWVVRNVPGRPLPGTPGTGR